MDLQKIRAQFPCLLSGKAYLDSAATAHKAFSVINTVSDFYSNKYASVNRGLYAEAEAATVAFESAREKVANFLNVSSDEIVFTSGATAGINFVADSWGYTHLKQGDQILLTEAEHHANLLPWQRLASRVGAELRFIPIDKFTFQLKFSDSLITTRTKIVALTHCSNVLGPVWGDGVLDHVIRTARQVGARILIDGAQSVAHQKIDLTQLDPDFFVFSSHKLGGPTGVGVLFIKRAVHHEVEPYQLGGGIVKRVTFHDASFLPSPRKFEAGTPPIAEAIGLGATLKFFQDNIDFDQLQLHESSMCRKIITFLSRQPGVRIFSPLCANKNAFSSIVSFNLGNRSALESTGSEEDFVAKLSEEGVSVRVGHHCAQPLHEKLEIDHTIRISLFCYNSNNDVDKFCESFTKVQKFFNTL